MSKKAYSPIASYAALKQVESKIEAAKTIDEIRKVLMSDGGKVGYKAFCYILMGKMTPEAMKPDEAAAVAIEMQKEANEEEAKEIFRRILAFHPNHPIAVQPEQVGEDDLPGWIVES